MPPWRTHAVSPGMMSCHNICTLLSRYPYARLWGFPLGNTDSNGAPGEYDPDANLYRVHYDDHVSEPVSTVIVKAVAAFTNTPPTELPPLYEAINPDALNRLYSFNPPRASGQTDGHVTFTYNDCKIRVFWTGRIEIEPPVDP